MSGTGSERIDELLARAGLAGMSRRTLLTAAAIAVVLVAGGVWRFWPKAPAPEIAFDEAPPAAQMVPEASGSAESSVVVHVTGAVLHPGVYDLPCGARVADALVAAGGAVGDAAPEGVNLARILTDGEQVYIPTHEELEAGIAGGGVSVGGLVLPGGAGTPAGAASGGLVNINTATAAELETLPGVGPATAQKIVDDRAANGPFDKPEDLMRVAGIGAKKFEALADAVTTR